MLDKSQRASQPGFTVRIGSYLINHARVLISSLGKLFYSPVSSAMTIAVIAIALALPSGFYVLLKNTQKLTGGWDRSTKLSVYLKLDITEKNTQALLNKLETHNQIKQLTFIDRNQALQEFRELSGFGSAMDALEFNPLPSVIAITPHVNPNNPATLESLIEELKTVPEIESVQLDMQWLKRLYAIISIVQKGLIIIAIMLGIAVILIIGNTIRLDIQNKKAEIKVIKLIGGTNAFIRRPYLYTGFWYGLLGGILSCIIISNALWLLHKPTQHLAGLYESTFELANIGFTNSLLLIGGAIILGYLGSWLAVGRHLKNIEPG